MHHWKRLPDIGLITFLGIASFCGRSACRPRAGRSVGRRRGHLCAMDERRSDSCQGGQRRRAICPVRRRCIHRNRDAGAARLRRAGVGRYPLFSSLLRKCSPHVCSPRISMNSTYPIRLMDDDRSAFVSTHRRQRSWQSARRRSRANACRNLLSARQQCHGEYRRWCRAWYCSASDAFTPDGRLKRSPLPSLSLSSARPRCWCSRLRGIRGRSKCISIILRCWRCWGAFATGGCSFWPRVSSACITGL